MDISSFSNDNFDIKEWVNETLKAGDSQDKKGNNYTMGLVMKLQLYVQQVNNSLEQSSQQVLMSLPRIIKDADSLQQEALILKEKMVQVKEEIVQIERETRQSIDSIEKLDKMKNKLAMAKQGLHESDNWTVLVNDLEEIFDSRNIEAISSKIIGMQNSLKLLQNVADYEDRKLQLEELKSRLEAIASPVIVQCFTASEIEQSVKIVKIFTSIQRLPQLLKYYHNCQKDVLIKKWRNQLDEQDDSTVQLIHNYYNILLANWHTQIKWFNQTFPGESAVDHLIVIYVDVLNSLESSLTDCVDAALKEAQDKLVLLGELKEVSKQFAENVYNIIEEIGKFDENKLDNLIKSIFAYLVGYVRKYATYEEEHLLQKLNDINCMKDELPDTIQALGLSVEDVIEYALQVTKRCKQFTESCGFCGLLAALRTYFTKYSELFRVALRQIDRSKRLKENWNTFQLCFSLLQYSGDVLTKVQQLEKDLTQTVLELNKPSSLLKYKSVLLDAQGLKEYDSLIKCITEGTQLSLLGHIIKEFTEVCTDIHQTTCQVVLAPIGTYLETVASADTWASFEGASYNSELPEYSFSPQEYITQIGQYLMELPQHLEPFLFKDNPSLAIALRSSHQEYCEASEAEGALAQVFLQIVARGACNNFRDKIFAIPSLTGAASRQLAHDINYLNNVLQDLGISISDNLNELSALLKIPSNQYKEQSIGHSAKFVTKVAHIRNIN